MSTEGYRRVPATEGEAGALNGIDDVPVSAPVLAPIEAV